MEPNKPVIADKEAKGSGSAGSHEMEETETNPLVSGSARPRTRKKNRPAMGYRSAGSHEMEEPKSVGTYSLLSRSARSHELERWSARAHEVERSLKRKERRPEERGSGYTCSPLLFVDRDGAIGRLIDGKVEREEKSGIIELMLATSHEPFRVIPICGGGGMGKTTLVDMVYKDKRVKEFFDLRVWVYASEDFDVLGLPRSVLRTIVSSRLDGNGMDLETKLHQTLRNQKFLIVLDGVCNLKGDDLDHIYHLFRTGVCGSKMIVTTRDHSLADMDEVLSVSNLYYDDLLSDRYRIFRLSNLSYDDLWSLLERHALDDRFYKHLELASTGREFMERCRGCPLEAVVLGGLLRTNKDPNVWETILHAEEWETSEIRGGIIPALMVSFRFLPSYLKPCFAYCSLFPKGYLFDKDELVRLWMAEGLLSPKDEKSGEEVGSIYFNDLSSRFFFQPSWRHEKLFEMHDMFSDLSKVVADDVVFHLKNKRGSSHEYELPPKIHRISFWKDTPDVLNRIQPTSRLNGLNTLLSLTSPDTKTHRVSLSIDALHKLLDEVSSLRVLSLNYYKIRDLPVPIRLMKHLRYLNLSGTQIKCLPEWVCDLIDLQTLLLAECHSLVRLPQGIGNLVNLCFLDISDTPKLQEMPLGIGCLKSLRILGKFTVGNDKGLGIKELGNLPWLQGDLLISGLHNVEDEEDAKKANLKDKDGLDYIAMEWGSKFDGSRNGNLEMKVMNSLVPHVKLDKLTVTCYGGVAFSTWIGHPSFENMSSIEIYDCKTVESLPSLGGLPLLRDLSIRGLHSVRTVGNEFYGYYGYPFKWLETLRFEDMPEWLDWLPPSDPAKHGTFRNLCALQIVNCPKLAGQLPKGIMQGVSPLERLEISGCPSLTKFREGGITTYALRQLIIHDCSQLECISWKLSHFNPSLVVIDFNDYTNLTSLPAYFYGLEFLVRLSIADCPYLKFFPDFPQNCVSFPKLEELAIKNCYNLESLPNHMINLNSLRSLCISNCPRLNSLPEGGFLPPNLTSLTVLDCDNIHDPISEWGLEKLSYLSVLFIGAIGPPDMATFPDYLCTLPPSITKLSVNRMQSLEYLGDRLLDVTSLKELQITDCPMLKYFPRDGLPPTLHSISIRGCPFLQERCARDEGEYWRFLAYIPIVETKFGNLAL